MISKNTYTNTRRRQVFFASLLFLVLFLALPAPHSAAAAAKKPAEIKRCLIKASGRVAVKASLPAPDSVYGSRCYLFALPISQAAPYSGEKPVASAKKAASMTFRFPMEPDYINYGFVAAVRNQKGTYTVISSKKYISNVSRLASCNAKFPTAISKKGLHTNLDMLEDAEELNVHNALINIVFTEVIALPQEENASVSYPYTYRGKTYWFRKYVVASYDRHLQALKATKSVNTALLLLNWRDDLTYLIHPDARKKGPLFYAMNTEEERARRQFEAVLSFLAERYSSPSSKYGRIVNWIVGNEVNDYGNYYYSGQPTLKRHAKVYADAFRLTYNTIHSVYSQARVYISLNHLWNIDNAAGNYASRKMLDTFASIIKKEGNIRWNLSYHPYNAPLTDPRFWLNPNKLFSQSLSSPVINMSNIGILSSYIRNTYGAGTRIILSEQGYNSRENGSDTQALQAAALAYSYYLTEADDMIDSFIMNRHVDHTTEMDQGLYLGLWTNTPSATEWAKDKKQSWNVFKYMDSSRSPKVTDFALSQIGAGSWADLIPGYGSGLYNKFSSTVGSLKNVQTYKKTASIPSKWAPYGAAAGSSRNKNVFCAVRDPNRNANCLWGFSQSFPGKLSLRTGSGFCTTVKVTGAKKGTAVVKLRLYSGKNIYECRKTVAAGRSVKLRAPLKNWKYRNKITKIEITVIPGDSTGWNSGAAFFMRLPVQGK